MRFLAIGDVIGKPGRIALRELLPALIETQRIDVVIANAENSAGGLGTTPETADDLLACGVNVVTGGNHTWKHREYGAKLDSDERCLRPVNYPGAPGRGVATYTLPDGRRYAVLNAIGRTFMPDLVDDPFHAVDRALGTTDAKVIVVDFHAEASSEKRAMGHHLDGRVAAMWGTHTHVPTADEEILQGGTAYLTDVGMTGPYRSVIGLDPVPSVARFLTGRPSPYKLASEDVQLRALIVEVDDTSGRAISLERVTRKYPNI